MQYYLKIGCHMWFSCDIQFRPVPPELEGGTKGVGFVKHTEYQVSLVRVTLCISRGLSGSKPRSFDRW